MTGFPYSLPAMVADRYVFNRLIRETRDTIVYGAVQQNIQRDVVVETLRPSAMEDLDKVKYFLDTARVQANVDDGVMGTSLELFFTDKTWHYVREHINGKALNILLENGEKLSAGAVCELLIQLCRSCVYMDMLGVDNAPFTLHAVYRIENGGFRYDNPAVAGRRPRSATRAYLTAAVTEILPLLDMEAPLADHLHRELDRIRFNANWSHLEPLYLDEQLTRLQLSITQGNEPQG